MTKRVRYLQVYAEAGKFSKEIFFAKKLHKMCCCDCGLVHDFKIKAWRPVYRKGKLIGYREIIGGVASYRVRRNVKATYGQRHKKKKKRCQPVAPVSARTA